MMKEIDLLHRQFAFSVCDAHPLLLPSTLNPPSTTTQHPHFQDGPRNHAAHGELLQHPPQKDEQEGEGRGACDHAITGNLLEPLNRVVA